MNYSYVMGINNIDELKQNNFKIKPFGNEYGVIFDDNKIELFEKYICETLENGFWNEYLGKDKVFIFKFKNGEIRKYVLNNNNEKEILKLCCEFAECEFESIDKMLRDNSFYSETYYEENKMQKKYKRMEHNEFLQYIDKICDHLRKYIQDNEIKIDYICPVLRSGAVPAVYISNKLNIIKFLPIQVKHIAYKNGDNKIEMIFNPFNSIEINKREPVFLVVEAMHTTGTSVEICINEIKNRCKNAKILYVCLAKKYNSRDFKDVVIYEDTAFYYNGNNGLSKEKCEELNVEYFDPLFPWENLQIELEHPDDLEDNIFF